MPDLDDLIELASETIAEVERALAELRSVESAETVDGARVGIDEARGFLEAALRALDAER